MHIERIFKYYGWGGVVYNGIYLAHRIKWKSKTRPDTILECYRFGEAILTLLDYINYETATKNMRS